MLAVKTVTKFEPERASPKLKLGENEMVEFSRSLFQPSVDGPPWAGTTSTPPASAAWKITFDLTLREPQTRNHRLQPRGRSIST